MIFDPYSLLERDTDERALQRCWYDLSDLGNARRLLDHALGHLKYLADHKAWVAFDGTRWTSHESLNGERIAGEYTHIVREGLRREVRALAAVPDDQLSEVFGGWCTPDLAKDRKIKLAIWGADAGNAARSNGMLTQAKRMAGFVAQLEDFDTDLYAYHVTNGTLRFSRNEGGVWAFRFEQGHRPEDYFMQIADVAYDGGAPAPYWYERLFELHDDPVQRTAIQRIYGMTLTGLISDQAFYVFQGGGNDGKSMTNEIIGALHGDYFRSSDPSVFLETGSKKDASAHQSAVVRLSGDIRLVVADEPPKRATWDANRIKQVTGSKVTARGFQVRTEITFVPRWQLIVECNGLPKMPGDDRGFRRRFKLYPWLKTYGLTAGLTDEAPHIVKERLLSERSGILNWMIQGALDWLNSGVVPEPFIAKRATESFWDATSPMGAWISACCDLTDPEARVGATELYQHFRQFRLDAGDKEDRIMSQTAFGSALNDKQIYSDRNKRTNLAERVGIRIRKAGEMGADCGSGDDMLDYGSSGQNLGGDDADPFAV